MNQTIINIFIILIIALIVFLTIRFVLQMVFLKECPHCGKTVSLAVKRECPKCGYVFLKNRHAKLNLTIALLIMAIVLFVFLDIYLFRKKTSDYLAANPYLWRGEVVSTEAVPVETEVLSEEMPAETPQPEAAPQADVIPEAAPAETPQPEAAPEEAPVESSNQMN